jgi:DNA-binding NtrC family response regulator
MKITNNQSDRPGKSQSKLVEPIALLVDKKGGQRELYKNVVASSGFLVVEVETVEQAMDVIGTLDIDVVICDQNDPSRKKVKKEIKKGLGSSKRKIPVVEIDSFIERLDHRLGSAHQRK